MYPQGLEQYVLASHLALPLSCQPVRAWLDVGSHKYVYHREGDQGQALSSRVTAETEPAEAGSLAQTPEAPGYQGMQTRRGLLWFVSLWSSLFL